MATEMRLVLIACILLTCFAVMYGSTWRKHWWIIAFVCIPGLYLLLRGRPLRPTYIRIIPGRLDRLDFGFFGTRTVRVESVNLRGAKLEVDLTALKDFVVVEAEGQSFRIDRDRVAQPLQFALAVTQASLTTAETPQIPMDELVG